MILSRRKCGVREQRADSESTAARAEPACRGLPAGLAHTGLAWAGLHTHTRLSLLKAAVARAAGKRASRQGCPEAALEAAARTEPRAVCAGGGRRVPHAKLREARPQGTPACGCPPHQPRKVRLRTQREGGV